MRNNLLALLVGMAPIAVCSCSSWFPKRPDVQVPPSEATSLSYDLPRLIPETETRNPQRQGDVVVTLEPVLFAPKRSEGQVEVVHVEESSFFHESVILTRRIPTYRVEPEAVTFKIRVHNDLERVMRLDGTVVVFRVDGTDVAVPKQNYEEFLRGMITPRGEKEFTLVGPRRDQLPPSCLISVQLFDVVTATDAAGAPTVRSNFEWYFRYGIEHKGAQETILYEKQTVDWPQVRCAACGGSGTGGTRTCSTCNGTGTQTDKKGRVYTCYACNGSCRETYACGNCDGKGARYQRPSYPHGGQR